jgi:hypothetical protein
MSSYSTESICGVRQFGRAAMVRQSVFAAYCLLPTAY